ncbi:MAG: pilus assembly protein PilM [Planctomycetes bacterium]|nr:pilus assembly protein PilM [Planctomycetota bacterium]
MSRGLGLDLGRANVRFAALDSKKGVTTLTRYRSVELDSGESPQEVASEVFGPLKPRPSGVRVGATGADIMLRYLPVPEVEDWRLERLMDFEVRELESRSGSGLATSYNLLPVPRELDDEDTMLLGVIREDLLDGWVQDLSPVQVGGFTPNAVALYNAYLALGDHESSVTLLANVGAGTLDLALVRGTELYFARSVSTSLEKRDETLARSLGIDAKRAQGLIHQHLDLSIAEGQRVSTDADRVTRPLLSLYASMPPLLSGIITLCKAQARLRELSLDRVLLTGGGAKAKGLVQMLTARLRVPVSIWNPADMIDPSKLPEDEFEQLEQDGPASAIALGLALSAADGSLYALEILSSSARKARDFRERGVFAVVAGALAAAYLVLNYFQTSSAADDARLEAQRLGGLVRTSQASHGQATAMVEEIEQQAVLLQDLEMRYALQAASIETLAFLEQGLPSNLWVHGVSTELRDGKDWGMEGKSVPILRVVGRGEDASVSARKAFNDFAESISSQLPSGEEAARPSTRQVGQQIEWILEMHLLDTSHSLVEGGESEGEEGN